MRQMVQQFRGEQQTCDANQLEFHLGNHTSGEEVVDDINMKKCVSGSK